MTRVLVTGGSGYIAAHILALLLDHRHSVVTTVRSEAKASIIREKFPDQTKSGQLEFVFVEDFLRNGAFDEAVVSDPPFEAVIHTASPLPHETPDPIKDIVEPAIEGTSAILHSIKNHAPTVRTVIITSSFAAIADYGKDKAYPYSEKDWNPIQLSDVGNDAMLGYVASKTMAERIAWDFLEKEKPNFTISTIMPPLVLGPLLLPVPALANFSNLSIVQLVTGTFPNPAPEAFLWVDVREVALAHVLAMEKSKEGAANKRFFIAAGAFSNKELAEIIQGEWPDHMKDKMPDMATIDVAFSFTGYDNSRSKEILGLEYRSLKESVIDTVKSLPELNL